MDKLLEKLKLNNSRSTQNLGILLMLIVIVMILINSFPQKEKTETVEASIEKVSATNEVSFEEKLEKILSSLNGVKNVEVMIAYENTIEKVPLFDSKEVTTITEEVDKNGGERKTKEVNNEYKIAYEEAGNSKTALIKQSIMPKMIGVIVTYEGPQNSVTKENMINAIMAVTGLSSNKIQVFAK